MGRTLNILIILAIALLGVLISSPLGGYESGLVSAFKVHPLFGAMIILLILGGVFMRIYLLIKKW